MAKTRTNIVIDDDLMAEAMEKLGATTKREAVEKALQIAIGRQSLLDLRGSMSDDNFFPGYLEELSEPRWSLAKPQ